MANIHHSLCELVGHTPLLQLEDFERELGLKAYLLGEEPRGADRGRAVCRSFAAHTSALQPQRHQGQMNDNR